MIEIGQGAAAANDAAAASGPSSTGSPFDERVASLGYDALFELLRARHSVRRFTDAPIEGEIRAALEREIAVCNEQGGLSAQLVLDNPEAFQGTLAKYGSFRNVRNHLALVGPDSADLDERCGYFGERFVLLAQALGLNTCWVALTFRRKGSAARVGAGERFALCIAVGYGEGQGSPHKVKPVERLCRVPDALDRVPEWFVAGMDAAQLAPTALNQQRFRFELVGGRAGAAEVRAKALAAVSCGAVDLGIAKLHFELGANAVSRQWRFA